MLREKIRKSHSPAQYNELPTNESLIFDRQSGLGWPGYK